MNVWVRQRYLALTLVLYACSEDMALGKPVKYWASRNNHSIEDSVGQYADDVWDTEEDYETFFRHEKDDDVYGLAAGNHSETNKTNVSGAEHLAGIHWDNDKANSAGAEILAGNHLDNNKTNSGGVEEEFEPSRTFYADEDLHIQKKNGEINMNNADDSRVDEQERNVEDISSEGTASHVSTTTSYVTNNNVNTTSSYDHTSDNNAAVQNASQQIHMPSTNYQAIPTITQTEHQIESTGRVSEGNFGNEGVESEGRSMSETNDSQARTVQQPDHNILSGEQYRDETYFQNDSVSDRVDIFDGIGDGNIDGGNEGRDHIDSGIVDHHALQEGGNVTPVPILLNTEQNGENNTETASVRTFTEAPTLTETVSVASEHELSQLTPPEHNMVDTFIHDNGSLPENVDLPEHSFEHFPLTTEADTPSIVHSNETIQLIPLVTTSTTNIDTPVTTTSSVSPETTHTNDKDPLTPLEIPDITETSDEHNIVKPSSTQETHTQNIEDTITRTDTTQATINPPTVPFEPEPAYHSTTTSTADRLSTMAFFTTSNFSQATEALLEMPTETSGEVTPDVKHWNVTTTSIPADVSMEPPLDTLAPPTSESFPDDAHEKFLPTTEKTKDYFYHPSSATATSNKGDLTTVWADLLSAVALVPTGEPAVGSVNCSDDEDSPENPSASDKAKKTPMPSTYLVLELAISWSMFCSSQDIIKSEIYGILNNGTVSLNVDQIHVYNPGNCHCADTAQLIHVSIYLLNKTLIYDQELTLLCGNTLKKFQGHSDSFLILNKLKGVIINGDPIKTEPVQSEDSSLLSDPGVTVAIVLAVVGGCCCIALISLQVIVRRRNKDHLSLKPNLKRSVSWSSDSIRLSAINKSRPNSGLFNPGLDLTDLQLEPSRPLNYTQLSNYCCNQKKIEDEFQTLPYKMPRLSVVPNGEEDKNRYANVLPLTHTRVKLLQDEPEPRGTYINANYVTGPNNQCQYYIATQAPILNTVADFWTMIWQQNSKAIVMLTQLEEDGQSKSVLYWPELVGKSAAVKYGDFLIELKQKDVHQEYIVSKLEVHHLRKIEKREVFHFWYTCWPPQGLPEPISLVKLVLDIRPKYEDGTAPLVVHCSPGTGRTGTYIALDLCMRQFETLRNVDLLKTVYLIRQERAGAVQSKEQYYLLYNAISEYATIVVSPVVSTASSATTLHALLSS